MRFGAIPGVTKPVSRIVFGCGGLRLDNREKTHTLLDAFHQAGGTALDTAFNYGRNGASERAVGQWIAERGVRSDVVIITKGAHHDAEWRPRVRPEVITQELTTSLERLGTDYVDLYLLHRDDPQAPVGPIIDCLNEHLVAGRIRAFGGSNWTPRRIEEANAYAAAHGLHGMVASSPNLALAVAKDPPHMGHATVSGDAEALQWYERTRFPLFAWSAQAQGFFSERGNPDNPEARTHFRRYDDPRNWERWRRVHELASKRGRTPTQIALAWVLDLPLEVYAVVGPGTVPHLEDTLAAQDASLTPAEIAWLDLRDG